MAFLYIKIPFERKAFDRLHRREEAIDLALRAARIGSVAGWGDSLADSRPIGERAVAYTRVDVDVSDIAQARQLLRDVLPQLHAAPGTQIHYTIDHLRLEDRYTEAGWLLDQPVIDTPHVK